MKKRIFGLTKPFQLRTTKLLILATLFFCSIGLAKAQDPPDWAKDVPAWFPASTLHYWAYDLDYVTQGKLCMVNGTDGPCFYHPNWTAPDQKDGSMLIIKYLDANLNVRASEVIDGDAPYSQANGMVHFHVDIPHNTNYTITQFKVVAYSGCYDTQTAGIFIQCCNYPNGHQTTNCTTGPNADKDIPTIIRKRRMKYESDPQAIAMLTDATDYSTKPTWRSTCVCCDDPDHDYGDVLHVP